MKTILLIALVAMASVNGFSRTSWAEDNLKGNVRERDVTEFIINDFFGLISTNKIGITVYQYDTNGMRTKRIDEDRLGLPVAWFEYFQDSSGLRKRVRQYDDQNLLLCYMINEFDTNGFLTGWSVYSNDNSLQCKYKNTYDSNGNMVEQGMYTPSGATIQKDIMEYTPQGEVSNDMVYRGNGTMVVRYIYDYLYDPMGNVRHSSRSKIAEEFGKAALIPDRVYEYTNIYW